MGDLDSNPELTSETMLFTVIWGFLPYRIWRHVSLASENLLRFFSYSAIKNNEIILAEKWVKLEIILLCEKVRCRKTDATFSLRVLGGFFFSRYTKPFIYVYIMKA